MSYITENGFLKVKDANIINEKNEIIQLFGISSFSLGEDKYKITKKTLETLKKDWHINCFRIAVLADGKMGYCNHKEQIKQVTEIIDYCIETELYCLVDWHIYYDGNPLSHLKEAKEFFKYISKKYGKYPNILYEICNEPHGENVNFENSIKPYAQEIIKTIRNNNSNNIIIVGTPNWSNNIEEIENLNIENIMYTFHFYPTSDSQHTDTNINKLTKAVSKKIPIFVTEFGVADAWGKDFYKDESEKFINKLNELNRSHFYWSLSAFDHKLSILKENVKNYDDLSDDNLSETGKFIKDKLLEIANKVNI